MKLINNRPTTRQPELGTWRFCLLFSLGFRLVLMIYIAIPKMGELSVYMVKKVGKSRIGEMVIFPNFVIYKAFCCLKQSLRLLTLSHLQQETTNIVSCKALLFKAIENVSTVGSRAGGRVLRTLQFTFRRYFFKAENCL